MDLFLLYTYLFSWCKCFRCKEAPKACRNFIQLCQEGYYDNTIFHRIIAGEPPPHPRARAARIPRLLYLADASVGNPCSVSLQRPALCSGLYVGATLAPLGAGRVWRARHVLVRQPSPTYDGAYALGLPPCGRCVDFMVQARRLRLRLRLRLMDHCLASSTTPQPVATSLCEVHLVFATC